MKFFARKIHEIHVLICRRNTLSGGRGTTKTPPTQNSKEHHPTTSALHGDRHFSGFAPVAVTMRAQGAHRTAAEVATLLSPLSGSLPVPWCCGRLKKPNPRDL